MRKFCATNSCEIVIIPHNLTNKFQPLDISVKKAGKSFISDKYNSWLANEVSKQLRAQKAAADVKVSLKLSVIRSLHAKWIVDLYNTLKDDKKLGKCRDYWSYWECQSHGRKSWELFQGILIVKHVFSTNIWSDDMTHFSFLFKFPYFNYPSLPNAAQPNYRIINLINFFKISIIWLLFRRKNNW